MTDTNAAAPSVYRVQLITRWHSGEIETSLRYENLISPYIEQSSAAVTRRSLHCRSTTMLARACQLRTRTQKSAAEKPLTSRMDSSIESLAF